MLNRKVTLTISRYAKGLHDHPYAVIENSLLEQRNSVYYSEASAVHAFEVHCCKENICSTLCKKQTVAVLPPSDILTVCVYLKVGKKCMRLLYLAASQCKSTYFTLCVHWYCTEENVFILFGLSVAVIP